jgi:putative Mg2+ transporter-C (MgtC) family protein
MEALFTLNEYEFYGRLILALFLGMALGIERTISGKRAGMRTFALVSLGSCFFMVISELLGHNMISAQQFDPTRIAAAIVTGVGFLGAGVIIFHQELKGLTTAAGLWVASAIGVAVGSGLYTLSIFATFLALFVFTTMWHMEQILERHFGLGQADNHNHKHQDGL